MWQVFLANMEVLTTTLEAVLPAMASENLLLIEPTSYILQVKVVQLTLIYMMVLTAE